MNRKEIRGAARYFNAARARRNAVKIWEEARWMDTPAIFLAADAAAACLREAGIEDVRVEKIPYDGKTSVGGWMMPVAWSVREARLETAGRGPCKAVFADYAENPQNIAVCSPGTPGGRWVEGEVAVIDRPESFKGTLKGKFLILSGEFAGSAVKNELAAKRGALAVIALSNDEDPRAARFMNSSVPPDVQRKCVPCFSLTPAASRKLSKMLTENPGLRLRARVKARRYSGAAPLLTGSVGEGALPVYVCGHIDEIGAQDNASGCGVAIEALCALQRIAASRKFSAQRRRIEFFFSTEVRGLQYWLNQQQSMPKFLGGINLDMVGADPVKEGVKMMIGAGFQNRPHFAAYYMRDAVRLADREVGGMVTKTGFNFCSDGQLGLHHPGGHVSLEQEQGRSYHSSADTAKVLSVRAMKWTGTATTAFLYMMSRMDSVDAVRVARRIHRAARKAISGRSSDREITVRRAIGELATLQHGIQVPKIFCATPEAMHKASVRRSSGCWPQTEHRLEVEGYAAELKKWMGTRKRRRVPDAATRRAREQGDRIVPVARFRGFLSFEDHVTRKSREILKKRTGLMPGWGTNRWIGMMVSSFRGKRTLTAVLDEIAGLGIHVFPKLALQITEYLAEIGLVDFRSIIDGRMLRASLRAVGVKKGSVLLVHSSLSRFGYVKGGAKTVVDSLLDVLGPGGTLVLPAFHWAVLGRPAYDVSKSPADTGAIPEFFRTLPGVVRSVQPTHPMCALGPAAAELVGADKVDQAPFARDGFWGKLYELDGDILLMCPIGSGTVFHVGETWAGLPQGPLPVHALDEKGRRHVYVLPNAPWHSAHFQRTMADPLIRKGIMRCGRLGESEMWLAPARAMIDISTDVNRKNPRVSLGNGGKCDCYFCAELKKGLGERGVGSG